VQHAMEVWRLAMRTQRIVDNVHTATPHVHVRRVSRRSGRPGGTPPASHPPLA
jgi:hypothetical protein